MRKQDILALMSALTLTSASAAGVNSFSEQKVRRDTLPEVTVNARKKNQTLTSSTPFHKIDAERIKTGGITDISDAIRRLPGVNLRDYGGAGGLKTVSVRGLGAAHTAVVYDGIPLSDVQSGQIDLARYSLENLSSLELAAGDYDDIFIPARATASAATLIISSFGNLRISDPRLHLKTLFRIGSFGTYNPYFRLEKSNGRNLAFSAIGEYFHAKNNYPFTLVNGDIVSREKRNNSMMNSWHGELNGMWKPSQASSLSAKVYYYDNSRQLPGPVIYYVSTNHEHLHDRNFFGQLRYRARITEDLSLLANAKFNWGATRYKDYNGRYPGGVRDQYYLQREAYASAAMLYTPFQGFAVDYSADWFFNNLSSNLQTDIKPYRNSILQSLTAKYRFWKFTAMARALYSIYRNDAKKGEAAKNESRLSPSVSLSFKPSDTRNLYIRASYKNIFRLPSFDEAYFDHYGSINLNPETTDQLNLGLTWSAPESRIIRNLSITADGYMNLVRNKIVAIPYNMFVFTMTNLGKVRVFGAEVSLNSEIELTPRHSLLISATYSYQRAHPRTDRKQSDWMKQVAYTPLNSGAASLTWMNPWVNLGVHATGSGPRFTTNNNIPETKIAGYIDVGFTLFRKFSFGRHSIELRADLVNAFNRQYQIVARYPMPGRSWQASICYEM